MQASRSGTSTMTFSAPWPSKRMKKYWDGHLLHPFVEAFHAALLARGYRFSEQSEDESCYTWSKPLFAGYTREITVMPTKAKGLPRSYFGFNIHLFIGSDRQTEVENAIGTWECYRLDPLERVSAPQGATAVLHESLQWLMARWEPRLTSFSDAFARWEAVPSTQAEVCVDDVMHFFDRQGNDFFEYVGTPIKLANTLCDLDNFPGRTAKSGPGSVAAGEYAAVLLHDMGMTEEARKELDLSLRILQARVNRGERQQSWPRKSEQSDRWISCSLRR